MAKAKQVQSWGDIPQEKFEALYKAIEKLREEMIPRDCDGDHPIDIEVVNRMTHERLSYVPVPRDEVYSYVTHGHLEVHPDKLQEMQDETERALTANVHMASEALERYMRIKQHRNWRKRESQRPFADRIREACPLCKRKVGFADHAEDFYKNTREHFPSYPFNHHDNGEECKAFDLRRAEWRIEHPEAGGKPDEPRWCMNPDCRCKLPEHNSARGKRDKNVCVNKRCGLDNSKHYPEARKLTE